MESHTALDDEAPSNTDPPSDRSSASLSSRPAKPFSLKHVPDPSSTVASRSCSTPPHSSKVKKMSV